MWAVDPVDGTQALSSGFPFWAISIGFLEDGKPSMEPLGIRTLYLDGSEVDWLDCGFRISDCGLKISSWLSNPQSEIGTVLPNCRF
jgi:hypothetical protein